MKNYNEIYLPDIIGKGYKEFWNFKGRYKVVKGSRRSKKSKTTALWVIYNMMKYKDSNTLVVRKTYRTLKDSCFTELKWAIKRLQVGNLWDVKNSPLEMTYKPTGQKIYFRGLDDPLKITSITTEIGVLSWMWIEECYEISTEDEFDTLTESMLGDCPKQLFKQVIMTFNPWNEHHWLKQRFYDKPDNDTLAMTTTYKCNEWLSEADRKFFLKMEKKNPRRYQVAGLGHWGIVDGLVYENWRVEEYDIDTVNDKYELRTANGLDFGYTIDPSAFIVQFVDMKEKKLFVWDELYEKKLSNEKIYRNINNMGYSKDTITADSAEPKSIDELYSKGLNIFGARKGRDSVNNGIQFIQEFEIIIHPRCVNFKTEISNYTWEKNKYGEKINKPVDMGNHLMDAMRYGMEPHMAGDWLY